MAKKLIFIDMDGTLIDHKVNQIPPSALEAIRQLKNAGHICAIATGRCPSLLYGFDQKAGIDYVIASNGRYVRAREEVIHLDTMPEERVRALSEALLEHRIGFAFQTADRYVAKALFGDAHEKFATLFNEEVPVLEPDYPGYDQVLQIIIYTEEALPTVVLEAFEDFSFVQSCPYGYDLNRGGGLKEVGVKILRERLNVAIEDTIAVGDGRNDISMFHYVHTSIAMGNAIEEVKASATMVTKPVDEDGLFHAFEQLKLIKKGL